MAAKATTPLLKEIEAQLVKGALPGELAGLSGADRTAAALLMSQAASKRISGKPSIAFDVVTGESHRTMRLAIANDDMPFLVDSIAAEIAAHHLSVYRVLHPVVRVTRDGSGQLTGIAARPGESGAPESFIYMEIERADARTRQAIIAALKSVLSLVRSAVVDWHPMQKAMRVDAGALRTEEGAELLHWFGDRNFTMLGHARFLADGSIEKPLGIARRVGQDLLSPLARSRAMRWLQKGGDQPLIIKSNMLSPVHRRVPLELVILPVMDGKTVAGLSIHAGLWTSSSLNTPPETVPVLRRRLTDLQKKYGFDPTGHAGKALTHALTTLPHDVLIAMDSVSLETVALTAMSLADRPRASLTVTPSPLNRHIHAFVWLPRDELTTTRRLAITAMISKAADAPLLSWGVDLDDSGIALIRLTLDIRDGGSLPDSEALNAQLAMMLRGWKPAVEAALAGTEGTNGAARLMLRFADAFPAAYRDAVDPVDTALDMVRLGALDGIDDRAARLFARASDTADRLRLKLYSVPPLALSDAVPVLENFGFRVIEEFPTSLTGAEQLHLHEFVVELPKGAAREAVLARATTVEGSVQAVLKGQAENDRFNDLVVTVGLDPFDVVLLRAWFRYLRQIGQSFGLLTVVDALRKTPHITRALIALFRARHDPMAGKDSASAASDALKAIEKGLAAVTSIEDDRILRMIRAVIMATLRTNAFSPAAAEAVAFKLDSSTIPGLPAPVPWREVFVYAPRVEGIHLRAGPVARGGLRWSDRRDDFRTEILGLMKAQRVKNAVIVPTGAKGGFYPKMLPDPADREAWLAEGTESYRIFIRTLLSITDNLVRGKVVHPTNIVCHDGDDPYFVVAADKGTATFSDVANAIALERDFWLGDAFASGGSVGYDHKAMGITAKGGWVSVKRHFAEMGVDVQKDSVRVAGCGDMSGDVFGNGMLLSKAIKLVAAFDHRHIFFDPYPDPAKSWKERDRLFKLPRSSWADYDPKLLSKGGGVFPRSAKTIKLSKEMRSLLGVEESEMEPSAILSAILKADVDLMWFGGIGTYVKARGQSNSEVGDRANDAHRVNAEELRCKVIGEGANLGMTQEARIAFGLKGGRSNTDFIDNSAGVDCSDNEVNIKIALNTDVAAGKLKMEARNRLLARMTDDVSALVLEDNRLQTLALSIAERDATGDLPAHIRLIENFEAHGKLDRAVEGIAVNDELLRRVPDGKGLTRPELAVLLATAKLALQDGIEGTKLGSDPACLEDLMNAFPAEMQKRHASAIQSHRLRGEIIATKLANRIVNRMGIIHPFELAEEEGATLGDVAEAFVIAEQIYDLNALWSEIDAAIVPEATRLMLFEQVAVEMRAHMADILRNAIESRSNDVAIKAYAPVIKRLSDERDMLLPRETRRQADAFGARLLEAGAPKKIADQLVRLAELDGAIGLAALSARSRVDVITLTKGFTALGEVLGLDWAQGVAMQLDPEDPWERLLAAGLARDLQAMRLDFLSRHGGKHPEKAVASWSAAHAERVTAFRNMIDRARVGHMPTAAMLAQIAGQARVLLSR
jgi:glutamate dehydrogenase